MRLITKPHLSKVRGYWVCSCEQGITGIARDYRKAYKDWKMFYNFDSLKNNPVLFFMGK